MLIRPVEAKDSDSLGLIQVTASHSAFVGRVPEGTIDFSWTPTVSAANWTKFLSDDQGMRDQLFVVAVDDNQVVGFVWASAGADTPGFEWSVRSLHVLPARHSQGIGRMLVSHVAGLLALDGVKCVEIGCVKENLSRGFYENLGDVEVGRRPVKVDEYETGEVLFRWSDLSALMDAK